MAAIAAPLVLTSVAQAAMAGANPLTTTSRPDLRSATITGASTVRFCFDKQLVSVPNTGGFYLGGYRADAFLTSNNATLSTTPITGTPSLPVNQCVDVTFPASVTSSVDDIAQHSFAQVAEGAVRATGAIGNRADSTALTNSVSQNGLRGLTTAPDLTGVAIVGTAPGQIAYTFDQNVNPSAIFGNGGFHFNTANGTDVSSISAAISTTDPRTVIATFPIGGNVQAPPPAGFGTTVPTPLVSNAVRAYVQAGTVQSQTVDHTLGTYDSQPLPNSSGATQQPDLISAQYSRINSPDNQTGCGIGADTTPAGPNCVVVDYTFDKGVIPANLNRQDFYAYLSDGSFVQPTTLSTTPLTLTPGTATVRAYFAGANVFDEYLVKAAVTPGAVVDNINGSNLINTTGSEPIGSNTGGFASGYSTAPDAFSASFDTATNTASVLFDQRVFQGNPHNYVLLDANGNGFATATQISSCPVGAAGFPCGTPVGPGNPTINLANGTTTPAPMRVYLTFASPTVLVGNARALEIQGSLGSLFGPGGTFAADGGALFAPAQPQSNIDDSGNVQQIVSPAATAAFGHLRASRHASHRRLTRSYERHVLAKQRHRTAKKH